MGNTQCKEAGSSTKENHRTYLFETFLYLEGVDHRCGVEELRSRWLLEFVISGSTSRVEQDGQANIESYGSKRDTNCLRPDTACNISYSDTWKFHRIKASFTRKAYQYCKKLSG